jgi:Ca2+-binding EF-hand superfamily protein
VLFSLLDANHDHRLTPRELRKCNQTLLAIDSDGDGRVTLVEIPAALALWLGRGLPPETAPRRFQTTAIAETRPADPTWFLHMDANRDQEVSAQEFPGSSEKFRLLDSNGDGFIVESEARAAELAARH